MEPTGGDDSRARAGRDGRASARAGARVELPHNRMSGVTSDVWLQDGVVHKVIGLNASAHAAHWAASDDPRHWSSWRREADVHLSGLPAELGLRAPTLLALHEREGGQLELELELVAGATGAGLRLDDLVAASGALGRAQGAPRQPQHPWLSRGFLRDYATSRPVRWELLDDPDAWAQALVARHFPPALRDGLRRLHARAGELLALAEASPRAVCHLDVWPNNLIRRPTGELVFLDWAFCGDGALGEDVANLVPDSVFDLHLPHERLDELAVRAEAAYLDGLRAAGWDDDPALVALGIRACAVKYDWLTCFCLAHAADEQRDYGQAGAVDPDARYAARAAGLALCARWADEAEELSR